MSDRYTRRRIYENRLPAYREQRKDRGVRLLKHYSSPNMRYPTPAQLRRISSISHTWRVGDRYYKLAHDHYGERKLWWLIAWFNMAPTESHLIPGQVIQVPMPLEAALSYMREA